MIWETKRILGILLFVCCLISCDGRSQKDTSIPFEPEPTEPSFIPATVPYCWEKSLGAEDARVQILLDASGSMVGFRKAMPRLSDWLRKGVSQLIGNSIHLSHFRQAQFTQERGIHNLTHWNQPPAPFQPGGNTNLHDAIRESIEYDLSMIVTDGVGATGSGGSRDCPGGVDASCVARALRDAIHAEGSRGGGSERGLWIIPLAAVYDGKFYTEEMLDPAQFGSSKTIDHVESEVGIEVRVINPSTDNTGRLTFNYRGPRYLLLIILSREADLGRNAVYALMNNATFSGIDTKRNLGDLRSDLLTFMPIEVYPGFLSPVSWQDMRRADNPDMFIGTMDAKLSGGNTIKMDCLPDERAEGVFELSGKVQSTGGACIDLHMLPAFSFEMRPESSAQQEKLAQVLRNVRRADNSYNNINLHLSCPADSLVLGLCSSPSKERWTASMNYAAAADCLDDSSCQEESSHGLVRRLSTTRPSLEPHRIYGFEALLEGFLRSVSEDERRLVLAELGFCQQN